MIRTMLRFEVEAAQSEMVIERYIESRIFEASIEAAGALSCEILQDVQHPGKIRVLALWEDQAAYDVWLNHPVRAEFGAKLADLGLELSGSVYEIRTTVSA